MYGVRSSNVLCKSYLQWSISADPSTSLSCAIDNAIDALIILV
jgi:hypothetical protein